MSKVSDYSKAHLRSLPTLVQSYVDDLKMETETERIWISRLTKADGVSEDNKITVEKRGRDYDVGWVKP